MNKNKQRIYRKLLFTRIFYENLQGMIKKTFKINSKNEIQRRE